MSKSYNFDDVSEYFEFIVRSHKYRFTHPNSEEAEKLKDLGDDTKKANDYLFSFIKPVDKNSPPFSEVMKKMIAPQWAKFKEMITTEFGG